MCSVPTWHWPDSDKNSNLHKSLSDVCSGDGEVQIVDNTHQKQKLSGKDETDGDCATSGGANKCWSQTKGLRPLNKYGWMLTKPHVQLSILVVTTVLLAFSICGNIELEKQFDPWLFIAGVVTISILFYPNTLSCRIVPPGLLLGRVFKKPYFGATVICRAMEICKIHIEKL